MAALRGMLVAAALAASLVLGGAAGNAIHEAVSEVPATQSAGAGVTTGCALRNTSPGGWEIYENAVHVCDGAVNVHVEPDGDLYIEQTPGHTAVRSMIAEEDESIARVASAGPSGGIGFTIVRFYDRDGEFVRADSAELAGPYANLWMTWNNID